MQEAWIIDAARTLRGIGKIGKGAELDALALESQRRAEVALRESRFHRSLVAVHDDDGCILLDREEFPQPNKTAEALAQLQPALVTVYKPKLDEAGTTYAALVRQAYPDICINHVHTAGTSSGVVDGAGALLLASPEYARAHNFKPRARIRALVHWSLPVQIRRLC